MIIFAIPSLILGALGRRVAGGLIQDWTGVNTGDHPVRVFFGAMIALSAWLGGASPWMAVAILAGTWAGSTTGNNGGMAMGRGDHTFASDFARMSLHGLAIAVPVAFAAMVYGAVQYRTIMVFDQVPLVLCIACLACAPCYAAGWWIAELTGNQPRDMRSFPDGHIPTSDEMNGTRTFPLGFRGGSELGETIWGAAMGLGAYLSFAMR